MCVAAILHGPVSLDALKAMASVNRDGCGVAWLDTTRTPPAIRYVRGLDADKAHALLVDAPRPALFHARYATQGGKRPSLCHPFPLGDQAWSRDADGHAPAVLIHNGTWSGWRDYLSDEEIKILDPSDTQVAAWLAGKWPGVLAEVSWSTAVAEVVSKGGSPTLQITERGQWYAHGTGDSAGNRYSNLGWVDRAPYKVWTPSKSPAYGNATFRRGWTPAKGYRRGDTPAIGAGSEAWRAFLARKYPASAYAQAWDAANAGDSPAIGARSQISHVAAGDTPRMSTKITDGRATVIPRAPAQLLTKRERKEAKRARRAATIQARIKSTGSILQSTHLARLASQAKGLISTKPCVFLAIGRPCTDEDRKRGHLCHVCRRRDAVIAEAAHDAHKASPSRASEAPIARGAVPVAICDTCEALGRACQRCVLAAESRAKAKAVESARADTSPEGVIALYKPCLYAGGHYGACTDGDLRYGNACSHCSDRGVPDPFADRDDRDVPPDRGESAGVFLDAARDEIERVCRDMLDAGDEDLPLTDQEWADYAG